MRDKRLTRRTFLRCSGLVAAPCVIPAGALGAEGAPAPSERITIGQIGCGNRGRGVMKALVGNGAQMVAACDCYEDRRRQTAQEYNCAAFADFRELLATDGIDAVLVAVPEHWHAVICVEACRRGKDVFCEKPLAYSIREAQAVLEAARRYERVVQVGTQQRSDTRYRFACELVQNGYIGQLKSVETDPGGTSQPCSLPAEPVPPGMDWEMWLGPAPWAPYNAQRCTHLRDWWSWREYSGGLMTDRGAHDYDIVQWGVGMDGSGPVEVFPPDGKDFKMLTYRYANGVIMESGEGGWGSGGRPGALVIFKGTEGEVSVWRGGIKTVPASLTEVTIGPNEIHLYESDSHERNFLECVRTRQRPAADVGIGASSVNVCHIGNIAFWLNRPLKWDPEKLEFQGDDEANRYRWRPTREPWRI